MRLTGLCGSIIVATIFLWTALAALGGDENPALAAAVELENKYVGTEKCAECHQKIVENFRKNSGKAHTKDKAVGLMKRKLTSQEFEACLKCHSTGYGERSGFVSYEATPHLADVGCESCHGMGYVHIVKYNKKAITRKPRMETCAKCHDPATITPIKYKNSMYAGGH